MGRSEGEPRESVESGNIRGWFIMIMVILLQWNARSVLASGQEFKHYVREMAVKPDVICVQETWLKPNLDSVVYGYTVIMTDHDED